MISISIAAITRYSAASSRFFVRMISTYSRYWRVSGAIGMSRMSRFSLRIRYEQQVERPLEGLEHDLQRVGRDVEVVRQLDQRLAVDLGDATAGGDVRS